MNEETRETKFQNLATNVKEQENEEDILTEQKQKKRNKIIKITVISIIVIILSILSWANFIEPKLITVHEYKIETSLIPDSFNGTKIVHFSDIHYGTTVNEKELDKIISKINEINPDIIFFTGDLIDTNYSASEEEINKIANKLNNLKASQYKYAIYGDEDIDNKAYKTIMEKANFKLLDNENTLLYYQETTPIEITGYNITNNKPDYSIISNSVDDINTNNFFKIVLVHEPDSIDNIINYNPNLILAGDTLGGLIKLPLLKPLFLNDYSQKYYNSYYNINNTEIYINNGLGTSNINARLNNIPSINFYRLNKIKE